VNHPNLEGIALESEVPLDPANQTFHPGVGADGAAAAAGAVGSNESRAEPLLVGPSHEPLERAPVGAMDLLE